MKTAADYPPWEEMHVLRPGDVPQTTRWKAAAAFRRAGVRVTPFDMEWRTNRPDLRHRGLPKRTYVARVDELYCGFID